MTSVEEITPNTLLEDSEGVQLRVTEIHGDHDEITWNVLDSDGDTRYTETFPGDEIQTGFDHNELEIIDKGQPRTSNDDRGDGDETNHPKPEINDDLDPSELPEDDLYIRFGSLPPNERSTDHATNTLEDGVSVYAAAREPAPDDADYSDFHENPTVMYEPYGNKIQQVLFLMFRDTYLVTGDEVGRGTDGEPLLRNVEVIGELNSPVNVKGWVLGRYDNGPYDPTSEFKSS
jgi:hypothetical protein